MKVCGTRKQTGPDQVRIPVLLFFCSLGMFSTVSNHQHSATVTTKATKDKEGLNLLSNELGFFFYLYVIVFTILTSFLYRMLAASNIFVTYFVGLRFIQIMYTNCHVLLLHLRTFNLSCMLFFIFTRLAKCVYFLVLRKIQ